MGTVRHALLFAAAALCLTSAAARAQEPRGESVLIAGVADGETGQPLDGAIVDMPDIKLQGRALGGLAQATLTKVPAGAVNVRVHYFGYEPLTAPMYFKGNDTLEVVLLMHRQVTTLETIHVKSHTTPAMMQTFEQHQSRGFGRFVNGAQLDSLGGVPIWGVLQRKFPGIALMWWPDESRYIVVSREGSAEMNGQPCPIQVLINGVFDPFTDVSMLAGDEVAGMEYYSTAEVPVEWRRSGSACGVLAVWTKQ